MTYEVLETALESGDRVIFCSDGITETMNPGDELFGYDRTEETLRKAYAENLSPEELIDRILSAVDAFRGDALQSDDMTCVVMQVL